MEPFRTVTSVAAPLIEDDINTGEIAPGAGGAARKTAPRSPRRPGRRRDVDGREIPGFVLNEDRYRHTQILVAGGNFGCGSSSESSVWVPVAFGIRCIVARSFADIYRENCLKNGILPVVLGPDAAPSFESAVLRIDGSEPFTVDLVEQQISGAGGQWAFEVSPGERQALLEGLDPIGLSLRHADGIAAFEQKTADSWPWLANLTRSA